MKGSGGEEESNNTVSKADIDINITTIQKEGDGNWNHVTSPFKSTSKSSSLIVDDDKTAEASTKTPSVFSNLERSQIVDRFSNIFMERIHWWQSIQTIILPREI